MQLILASEPERDALAINTAMYNKNSNDIVEVLATRHANHIRHINQVYSKLYNKELPRVMESAFPRNQYGNLFPFLKELLFVERNPNNVVNTDQVEKDKELLLQAQREHTWNSETVRADVIKMLGNRSFGHLWFLLKKGFKADEYHQWTSAITELARDSDKEGHYTSAVQTFLRFIHDLPAKAFARSLKKALENPQDEDKVLYILISRQEYDLKDIKLSFRDMEGTPTNLEADLEKLVTKTFNSPALLRLMIKEYNQI